MSFVAEWRHGVLDLLVYLLQCGCVMPVLQHIGVWAISADNALTRYFATEVLRRVEGPYSQEFADSLLGIVAKAGDLSSCDEQVIGEFYGEIS